MRTQRIAKVHSVMDRLDVGAMLIKGAENIFYLSGFQGSEGTLFVTREKTVLITDFRYLTYAREVAEGVTIVEVKEREAALTRLCTRNGVKKAGFDSLHTTYGQYEDWQAVLKDVELVPAGSEIEEIRRIKESVEIDAVRKAISVATAAFEDTLGRMVPGMTERQVANALDYAMRERGADHPSFETIVASGPRAALPHAQPSDRPIGRDEVVIIDFGAKVEGYCSDETCTVLMGDVGSRLMDVFAIVNDARKLALANVKAGMPVKDLDRMVRGFIADRNYGEYFRHSTGHGLGIAVHESPAVNISTEGDFKENMIVTIEPGIYIPGLGGVRLEDVVLIENGGSRILMKIDKEGTRIRC
jgi:Xaa-Pro aminopeptidase